MFQMTSSTHPGFDDAVKTALIGTACAHVCICYMTTQLQVSNPSIAVFVVDSAGAAMQPAADYAEDVAQWFQEKWHSPATNIWDCSVHT